MSEATDMVQCFPCDSCNPEELKECVKEKHKMFHCQNVQEDQGAFCIFNYNLSGLCLPHSVCLCWWPGGISQQGFSQYCFITRLEPSSCL
ncbi:hypothetical protein OS493_020155 [Desmophyllum pertusum]|uniref:Uncharacterized protein n=1 Tax=Desmophyllum pertusum TaxID=174260 RepID=A0A9X0A111_9CNID|nr:hypothetical protein OS493_020155 [Desmophyllum pertusum]